MKLGTLLLRDAVISLSQLEAALRAQVVYGGKLGTNLVELEFITLDELGVYLSRVLDMPLATQDMFEAITPDALDAIGPGLADVYNAVPLRFEDDKHERLAVAMADPSHQFSLDKLATQCGVDIRPYVAPELRIFYYLERLYHLPRKARFLRTGGRPREGDRRRVQAPMGIEAPPAVVLTPGRAETQREFAQPTPRVVPQRIDLAEAIARIDAANSRDELGDVLIDFTVGRLGAAVLFLLRDRNAVGWRIHESGPRQTAPVAIADLTLPLGATSALQVAFDSREPFRGTPPSAGKPVERKLWESLGTSQEPGEMAVIPVIGDNRVINLLYGHCSRGESIGADLMDELRTLADRAGAAYERLMSANATQ